MKEEEEVVKGQKLIKKEFIQTGKVSTTIKSTIRSEIRLGIDPAKQKAQINDMRNEKGA